MLQDHRWLRTLHRRPRAVELYRQISRHQEFLGGPEWRADGGNCFGARRKVAQALSRASARELNRLCSGVTDAGRCLRQLASVCRLAPLLLMAAMTAGSASAHDASSYGGVFHSRNLGGTWLRADVGLFLNAALVVAVDPQNGSHLLAGTDLGLLGSRNGGLSWNS